MIIKLKILGLCLIDAICGFTTFFILPTAIMIALNRTHGISNNPDGEIFTLLGWLIIMVILLFAVALSAINMLFIRKARLKMYFSSIFLVSFILGSLIAFLLIS